VVSEKTMCIRVCRTLVKTVSQVSCDKEKQSMSGSYSSHGLISLSESTQEHGENFACPGKSTKVTNCIQKSLPETGKAQDCGKR
jgi:hypothetical protein